MKKCKNITIIMAAVCIIFTLAACNSQEFEKVRSFEYHFLKEEYVEEYNEVEKTIELESDANYEIKITSSRETGTIAMTLCYTNGEGEIKIINMTAPGTETVKIASGTTDVIIFTAQIDPDTEGSVEVEILRDNV